MVKLVKDERKIKQVGDKFLVERNVIEEFDAQEYLQHTAQNGDADCSSKRTA